MQEVKPVMKQDVKLVRMNKEGVVGIEKEIVRAIGEEVESMKLKYKNKGKLGFLTLFHASYSSSILGTDSGIL